MKKRLSKLKITIAIFVGLVTGLAFSLAMVFSKNAVHGKFPLGTFVAGVNISEKTLDEGTVMLNSKKEIFLSTNIEVHFLGQTANFKAKDLGVEVMVEETLKTIEQTDARKLGVVDLLMSRVPARKDLALISRIDYDKLVKILEEKFKTKDLEPRSATFYFDETGELKIKEEAKGIIINTEKLFEEIKLAANSLEAQNISIKTIEKEPAITTKKLLEQEEKIKDQLNQTITLIDPIYSDDWYLNINKNLDWIEFKEKEKIIIPYIEQEIITESTIEGIEGETFIAIEIKEEKLDEYINENISKWLDRPAEDVNMYFNEEGAVVIEGKGSGGKKVQRMLLKNAIEKAIAYKVNEIIIPIVDVEPKITIAQELQDLGIQEKIAVGHSSYYGSPGNRVHNIKIGAAKFNGKLIAPGEIFSFNQNLGRVDGSTGYKKELVIKKEGTIPEYGGGICQVSTTMFRTTLFGGLPITERNEHSYAVSYYSQVLGHGLDATIYLGGADFRFENNTKQHILIQTYTENDYELYIVFYGSNDGRQVAMEGPYLSNYHYPGPTMYIDTDRLYVGDTKQVEKPHTGFKALWYRHLTLADGTTETETIGTNYRAVPAKIWVGTKEKQVTPTPS